MLSSPRSNPRHALYVQRLGLKTLMRDTLSRQQDDFNELIVDFVEQYASHFLVVSPSLNIVQMFYHPTLAIPLRAA